MPMGLVVLVIASVLPLHVLANEDDLRKAVQQLSESTRSSDPKLKAKAVESFERLAGTGHAITCSFLKYMHESKEYKIREELVSLTKLMPCARESVDELDVFRVMHSSENLESSLQDLIKRKNSRAMVEYAKILEAKESIDSKRLVTLVVDAAKLGELEAVQLAEKYIGNAVRMTSPYRASETGTAVEKGFRKAYNSDKIFRVIYYCRIKTNSIGARLNASTIALFYLQCSQNSNAEQVVSLQMSDMTQHKGFWLRRGVLFGEDNAAPSVSSLVAGAMKAYFEDIFHWSALTNGNPEDCTRIGTALLPPETVQDNSSLQIAEMQAHTRATLPKYSTSPELAKYYLQKAFGKGDLHAALLLGRFYVLQEDFKNAEMQGVLAAAKGMDIAYLWLLDIEILKPGQLSNLAKSYLKKFTEQEGLNKETRLIQFKVKALFDFFELDASSKRALGRINLGKLAKQRDPTAFRVLTMPGMGTSLEDRVKAIQIAAELKMPGYRDQLGQCYLMGRVVARDEKKAGELFEASFEEENHLSEQALGFLLSRVVANVQEQADRSDRSDESRETIQISERSKEWVKIGTSLKLPLALAIKLYLSELNVEGFEEDPKTNISVFEGILKVLKTRVPDSKEPLLRDEVAAGHVVVAKSYLRMGMDAENVRAAIGHLVQASEYGGEAADLTLGRLILRYSQDVFARLGDPSGLLGRIRVRAEKGEWQAQELLGVFYTIDPIDFKGTPIVQPDLILGLEWILRAVESKTKRREPLKGLTAGEQNGATDKGDRKGNDEASDKNNNLDNEDEESDLSIELEGDSEEDKDAEPLEEKGMDGTGTDSSAVVLNSFSNSFDSNQSVSSTAGAAPESTALQANQPVSEVRRRDRFIRQRQLKPHQLKRILNDLRRKSGQSDDSVERTKKGQKIRIRNIEFFHHPKHKKQPISKKTLSAFNAYFSSIRASQLSEAKSQAGADITGR